MKTFVAILGLLMLSSVASAGAVTPLQRRAAAIINKSAAAKREGIVVKASEIRTRFFNGAHGSAFANAKHMPGAFPRLVKVEINGTKLTNVTITSTAVPGRAY